MGLTLRYLDSSVVLDLIDPAATRHARVDAAMLSVSPVEFAVSDLVRLECLIHAIRTNDAVRLDDLRTLFASVVTLPMQSLVFDLAARLRADDPKIKTPDALHLATAIHHGCVEFWTNDARLSRTTVSLVFRSF